jgi:hypothetical protein
MAPLRGKRKWNNGVWGGGLFHFLVITILVVLLHGIDFLGIESLGEPDVPRIAIDIFIHKLITYSF